MRSRDLIDNLIIDVLEEMYQSAIGIDGKHYSFRRLNACYHNLIKENEEYKKDSKLSFPFNAFYLTDKQYKDAYNKTLKYRRARVVNAVKMNVSLGPSPNSYIGSFNDVRRRYVYLVKNSRRIPSDINKLQKYVEKKIRRNFIERSRTYSVNINTIVSFIFLTNYLTTNDKITIFVEEKENKMCKFIVKYIDESGDTVKKEFKTHDDAVKFAENLSKATGIEIETNKK